MSRPVRTISTDACRVYAWFVTHNSGEATPAQVQAQFLTEFGEARLKSALRRLVTIGMLGNYTKRGGQGIRGLYATFPDADNPQFAREHELHNFMVASMTHRDDLIAEIAIRRGEIATHRANVAVHKAQADQHASKLLDIEEQQQNLFLALDAGVFSAPLKNRFVLMKLYGLNDEFIAKFQKASRPGRPKASVVDPAA